jgi:hypothetical protein
MLLIRNTKEKYVIGSVKKDTHLTARLLKEVAIIIVWRQSVDVKSYFYSEEIALPCLEVIWTTLILRQDAVTSHDATRNVVAQTMTHLSQDAAAKMPSVDALR